MRGVTDTGAGPVAVGDESPPVGREDGPEAGASMFVWVAEAENS